MLLLSRIMSCLSVCITCAPASVCFQFTIRPRAPPGWTPCDSQNPGLFPLSLNTTTRVIQTLCPVQREQSRYIIYLSVFYDPPLSKSQLSINQELCKEKYFKLIITILHLYLSCFSTYSLLWFFILRKNCPFFVLIFQMTILLFRFPRKLNFLVYAKSNDWVSPSVCLFVWNGILSMILG